MFMGEGDGEVVLISGGGDGEGCRAAVTEDVGDCASVRCGGGWELDSIRTAGRDIGESGPRGSE